MFDGKAFGEEIVAIVKGHLEREAAGISARLAAIEKRLDELPVPRDVDSAAITAQVRGELEPLVKDLADSVSALVIPELPDIPGMIAEAVAAIPVPKDGDPGKSVTVEECLPAIDAAVAKAVSALPASKDGEPGTSVTIEDVRPLIAEAARAELAGWERPKDGDPGKSVTVDDVTPIINEAVAKAVAEIPRPKDGEPGKLPIVKAWADEVHYAGEVRTHAGSTWQAVRDTAKAPPHADWTCIAQGGADGRSPQVRATWSEAEAYKALDIVALGGAAFIARRDEPGQCPGDGWQMIAMQGKQGKPGPAVKGDPGPAGKPAIAMSVDDHGMLTLTNGDGSTVECDLYPLLSKLER